MFTRKEYMSAPAEEQSAAFKRFYGQIVDAVPIDFSDSFIAEVKTALARGDRHLNTIALHRWDNMTHMYAPEISRELKNLDDFYSLGGGVCVLKEAARRAAITAATGDA